MSTINIGNKNFDDTSKVWKGMENTIIIENKNFDDMYIKSRVEEVWQLCNVLLLDISSWK